LIILSCLPDHQIENVLLIFAKIVVRIEGRSLASFVRKLSSLNTQLKPFTYHKWNLNGQKKINDVISCSESEISAFDVFKTRSPFMMVGAGKGPMLATYTTDAPGSQNVSVSASKLATKVATKVSSAVFSFAKTFIWGTTEPTQEQEEQQPSIDPAIRVSIKHDLADQKREIYSIDTDITGKFAVTSDSLGRVMILDIQSMTIIHIIKGHREAQCQWVYVDNHISLIVYAPLRGIMERYSIIDGVITRTYAAHIGVDKLMLYAPPMIGWNQQQPPLTRSECYMLSLDGSLERVVLLEDPIQTSPTTIIPTAEPIVKSDNSDDAHFLKRFEDLIRDCKSDSLTNRKEMRELLGMFNSYSYVIRALDVLSSCDHVPMSVQLDMTDSALSVLLDNKEDSKAWTKYKIYTQNRLSVLQTYQAIANRPPPPQQSPHPQDHEFEIIHHNGEQDWTKITGVDLDRLYRSEIVCNDIDHASYSYRRLHTLSLEQFLSCFALAGRDDEENDQDSTLPLDPTKCVGEKRYALATMLFYAITSSNDTNDHTESIHNMFQVLRSLTLYHADAQSLFLDLFLDCIDLDGVTHIPPNLVTQLIKFLFHDNTDDDNEEKRDHKAALALIIRSCKRTHHLYNAYLLLSLLLSTSSEWIGSISSGETMIETTLDKLQDVMFLVAKVIRNTLVSISSLERGDTRLLQLTAEQQIIDDGAVDGIKCESSLIDRSTKIDILLTRFTALNGDRYDKRLLLYCALACEKVNKYATSLVYMNTVQDVPPIIRYGCALMIWTKFCSDHLAPFIEYAIKHKRIPKLASHPELYKYQRNILDIMLANEPEYKEDIDGHQTTDEKWPPQDVLLEEAEQMANKFKLSSYV
jgi:hypothetical protein